MTERDRERQQRDSRETAERQQRDSRETRHGDMVCRGYTNKTVLSDGIYPQLNVPALPILITY